MIQKKRFKKFFSCFVYLSIILLFSQCAQIVPLTGGKRDIQPPKIISTIPVNYTKNFSTNTITLYLNEKIQLLNPNDNIIIVPSLSKKPEWKIKNKTLEIYIQDTLQANTTYKIIFNKTIADLTERNTLNYFEYVFSTGNYLDSLYIKGNVKNAFTLNNEKNVLVSLYNANENDSIVLKKPPLYFTKTDEQGNFIFKNLSAKNFKILAFTDNNNNFNYDPVKEKIDIHESPVNPAKDSIINFFIYEEKPSKNNIKKYYSHSPYQINIIYSYPDTYQLLKSDNPFYLINDTILSDTCKIFVHHLDTANIVVKNSTGTDTLQIPIRKQKNFSYKYALSNLNNNQYPFFIPLVITSNFWMDTSRTKNEIIFYKNNDSLNFIAPKKIQLFPDKIILRHPLEQNTSYTLKIPVIPMDWKDSITYQKITFKTNSSEQYAQLKLNILFPDKKNYIVALCNTQHKIIYSKNTNLPLAASNLQSVVFENVIPDTYLLKIIQDDNQNTNWDTHQNILNPSQRQSAEKIFLYPKPIKLINNWDVVLDWKEVK